MATKNKFQKNSEPNVKSDGPFAKKGVKMAESVSDGTSSDAGAPKESAKNVQFAKGGTDHMFGEQEANDAQSGETGKTDAKGPGDKFAEGGKTKMFGFQGAVPARDGITSSR